MPGTSPRDAPMVAVVVIVVLLATIAWWGPLVAKLIIGAWHNLNVAARAFNIWVARTFGQGSTRGGTKKNTEGGPRHP